jgi:hypothetical protein
VVVSLRFGLLGFFFSEVELGYYKVLDVECRRGGTPFYRRCIKVRRGSAGVRRVSGCHGIVECHLFFGGGGGGSGIQRTPKYYHVLSLTTSVPSFFKTRVLSQ